MRKITALILSLALGTISAANAQAATDNSTTQTLTVTNAGVDKLAVTGAGFTAVTFGGNGTNFGAEANAGSVTLTYDTNNSGVDGSRLIFATWAFSAADGSTPTAFPTGLSLKLTPTVPTATALDSDGSAGTKVSLLTFSGSTAAEWTNQAVITGISKYTTAGTANVAYAVTATTGFRSFAGTISYTIGTSF